MWVELGYSKNRGLVKAQRDYTFNDNILLKLGSFTIFLKITYVSVQKNHIYEVDTTLVQFFIYRAALNFYGIVLRPKQFYYYNVYGHITTGKKLNCQRDARRIEHQLFIKL